MNKDFEVRKKTQLIATYRAEIRVDQPEEGDHYKIATSVYRTDRGKDELVGLGMNFLSSGNWFALVTRFPAPDPDLGFVEVFVSDDVLFDYRNRVK